jgi:hypothetical protein
LPHGAGKVVAAVDLIHIFVYQYCRSILLILTALEPRVNKDAGQASDDPTHEPAS